MVGILLKFLPLEKRNNSKRFYKKDEKGKHTDNLFGSEKEDIQRRDITINYHYDPNKR